jgi:hypothetical protein
MVDKQGSPVTTSLTLIDIHDISRSAKTFGAEKVFVCHPSPAIRRLARTMKDHWQQGYGSTYNPNRKEAISSVELCCDLDEVMHKIELETGMLPKIIATSAKAGGHRVSFSELKTIMAQSPQTTYLMMLGTGWGMGEELLARADLFLAPVYGPGNYNHLSVRSACAIMLDRLFGK